MPTTLPPSADIAINPSTVIPQGEALAELLKQFNIRPNEYDLIKEGMAPIGRVPNFTELAMFSVLWSEHCCYKHSKHLLRKLPNKSPRVLHGPGENAGVVDIGDDIQIAFKIESHNHPTAVEPFQGATTGVGGILRDIFTMNARPIANLNALRFGPQQQGTQAHQQLEPAVLKRNQHLFERAVEGIAHYGNCVGVPTIAGEVFFDATYNENPLVNAMSLGILYGNEVTSSKAKGIGNPVLYVGSATGKDGMGGAAFASRELDENSQDDRPAVQVGDPFSEKLLIEACLEAFETGCVVAAQDMGAAGLTSSSAEMAAKGGVGMRIDLDKVPAREPDMLPHEFLMSESQERMLFILEKGKEQAVLDVFKKWQVTAEIVGDVTDADENGISRLQFTHQGNLVVDIPSLLLAEDTPDYDPGVKPAEPNATRQRREMDAASTLPKLNLNDVETTLNTLLSRDNIRPQHAVYEQYDRHVQNNTLTTSDQLGAGVIRIRDRQNKHTGKAIAATVDCNARYIYLNPESGTASAVLEAARNLSAMGAEPIAVTDNLNFGNPEKPEIYYQMFASVNGMSDACIALETPVISGNVSLYNEHSGCPILPAPVIGMVGLIDDDSKVMTPALKPAMQLALVGQFNPTLAGSEFQNTYSTNAESTLCGEPPKAIPLFEKELNVTIRQWIQQEQVSSVQDVSTGGLLVTLSECASLGNVDVALDVSSEDWVNSNTASDCLATLYFGETNGSYIIGYSKETENALKQSLPSQATWLSLGETHQAQQGQARITLTHTNKKSITLTPHIKRD